MSSGAEIVRVSDATALHAAAADIFVSAAIEAVRARGVFNVVLSGGTTPRGAYALLASSTLLRSKVPWPQVQVFWGDERHVPPDHPDSNFRMSREALLAGVPIESTHIWRIKGEYAAASQAADEYERDLRAIFRLAEGEIPRFDLILLGLGPDGHTASLFPGTAALAERRRLVVANHVEKLQTDRITMTVPVLNNGADVVFLVQGADKAPAAKEVLEGPADPEQFPAQLIRPIRGRFRWLIDPTAAHLLFTSNG